jgi:hypothetical protein
MGWMVGTSSQFLTRNQAGQLHGVSPGSQRHARSLTSKDRAGFRGLRWIVSLAVLAPLSCVLIQCGGSPPNTVALAANTQASVGDSFDDRFPTAQFNDRFQAAQTSSVPRQPSEASRRRTAPAGPGTYQVASLAPQLPYERPGPKEDQTTLVGLQSSAFPYLGNNPRTEQPFLNVSNGERRGHRGLRGHVYWQDETFNDNRVLIHVPKTFDVRKPGVIVVFFHGNGATLERDVRDRQMVPQQITDSGVNAVLLVPQLAVDAADSSAGKFWQPDGLKRFLAESAEHLAQITGDPGTAKTFATMPVVIVGYSGGFVPTAYSLDVGGLGSRVRGVFLLDAVYGELDKFASWIANNRSAFFVSSYTHYTKRHDDDLMHMLRDKGIAISEDMDQPLKPGSVVFVATPEGVTHRDYVTHAWTDNPVKEVLIKMAETPTLTRVAASAPRP